MVWREGGRRHGGEGGGQGGGGGAGERSSPSNGHTRGPGARYRRFCRARLRSAAPTKPPCATAAVTLLGSKGRPARSLNRGLLKARLWTHGVPIADLLVSVRDP